MKHTVERKVERVVSSLAGVLLLSGVAAAQSNIWPGPTPVGPRHLGPVFAQPADDQPIREHPEHVMVRFAAGATEAEMAAAKRAANAIGVLHTSKLVPGLCTLQVPAGGVGAAVEALKASPAVMYAHADRVGQATAQVQDYGISLLRAPQVWPTGRGGGVTIAVLDTGVDFAQPDLPVPLATESFVPGETVDDGNGHGTHCAGIAMARDNTIGVIGVAPDASYLACKVCDNSGSFCGTAAATSGIDWAVANGARVISMSFFVDDTPTQALQDTCDAAFAAGTLLFVAAGNSGTTTFYYPASYSSCIAVAAVDSSKVRASFSTTGPQVSLSAPGVGVLSTYLTGVVSTVAQATWDGSNQPVIPLTNTVNGSASGVIVNCGTGNTAGEFPAGVNNNIALIQRGGDTFTNKVLRAMTAGAKGVLISNNVAGAFQGTLSGGTTIPAVTLSQAAGNALVGRTGVSATLTTTPVNDVAILSGTSMACPHAAGSAATLMSQYPPGTFTSAQFRAALESTAEDLGAPGRDDLYGHGLINLQAAKAYLDAIRPPLCVIDYNLDGSVNPDDIGDFITDYFTVPAIPGPGGYAIDCPGNDPPYDRGYKVGFTLDGLGGCGTPNPDNLGDYITAYFTGC